MDARSDQEGCDHTLERQQYWCKGPRKYRKTTEVVRPCEENERGARSENNAKCGHTREKNTGAA